jgi:hypothetical protein
LGKIVQQFEAGRLTLVSAGGHVIRFHRMKNAAIDDAIQAVSSPGRRTALPSIAFYGQAQDFVMS